MFRTALSAGGFSKNRILAALADQRRVSPAKLEPLAKFLAARINPLQASQNAASLLNDLTPVDIR